MWALCEYGFMKDAGHQRSHVEHHVPWSRGEVMAMRLVGGDRDGAVSIWRVMRGRDVLLGVMKGC